ncbi:GIY-YIg endonuclease [Fadolivirus algeromassiliense]|jgi:predicted GIY-YIG superfamily endonuclease|uniref:GIY-YIg endonuclease n=1 Tax=Fadolivirus FV1/VV64 TaxID=3070911 RepID=A0A7D3QWI9_9VIRU|nr:GIY-YIg endonuclease [Fadolivirus algeromassiliense]QKF94626.1 GIY-YIg endonuclease [Fadolivirus FV1/VV64]
MNNKSYYCYLIISNNKTYIGITNNLTNRIKKHNGELKNGAKSTRSSNSKWSYHTVIGLFENKSKAQRFEWYWKHIKNSKNKWIRNRSGIKNKMQRLVQLLLDNEWDNVKIINLNNHNT